MIDAGALIRLLPQFNGRIFLVQLFYHCQFFLSPSISSFRFKAIGGAQQQGQQLAGQGQAAIGGAQQKGQQLLGQGQAALGGFQSKSLSTTVIT